jgi:hypothetical protein
MGSIMGLRWETSSASTLWQPCCIPKTVVFGLDSSGIPPQALLSIAEAPPFVRLPVISVVGLALLILPDVEPIGWFQANKFLCTTDFDSNIAVMRSAAIVSGYSGIRIWNLVQMACAASWPNVWVLYERISGSALHSLRVA